MKPSQPFLVILMVAAVAGASALVAAPHAQAAIARDSLPLSAPLTPAMIDYFALQVAWEPPQIAVLVACAARPTCGASDSVQVRFLDAAGHTVAGYDGAPTTVIEQVRRQQTSPAPGRTEQRTLVRRFTQEDHGAKVVMHGIDSIVTVDSRGTGREPSTLVRVHRYSAMRYLMNDPLLPFPLTGLVTLELSSTPGVATDPSQALAAHAAVSFDGSHVATIVTSGALTHRVDLRTRRLDSTLPDR